MVQTMSYTESWTIWREPNLYMPLLEHWWWLLQTPVPEEGSLAVCFHLCLLRSLVSPFLVSIGNSSCSTSFLHHLITDTCFSMWFQLTCSKIRLNFFFPTKAPFLLYHLKLSSSSSLIAHSFLLYHLPKTVLAKAFSHLSWFVSVTLSLYAIMTH